MSKGHCGHAHLVAIDDALLLYSYCAYDLNREGWQETKQAEDGEIIIDRDALIEPEIHEKQKRLPSGRKITVVKRIRQDVPYEDLLRKEKIRIKNASGTWMTDTTGTDKVALHLVWKVFDEYQDTGIIPENPTWFV